MEKKEKNRKIWFVGGNPRVWSLDRMKYVLGYEVVVLDDIWSLRQRLDSLNKPDVAIVPDTILGREVAQYLKDFLGPKEVRILGYGSQPIYEASRRDISRCFHGFMVSPVSQQALEEQIKLLLAGLPER
jgi:hypothetical protein